MGRSEKLMMVTFALLALGGGGCAMEGATDEDIAAAEEELRYLDTDLVAVTETSTRLTLYSEAGRWGTSLSVPLVASTYGETVRSITKTEVESAGLLGRISSLRLHCGDRDAQVVLFNAYNTSTSLSDWSDLTTGHVVQCTAGQTVDVELHSDAPGFANRVASVYFVQHARDVSELALSWLVTSVWNANLDDAPDGADPTGGPRLRLRGSQSFDLRQDFELDSGWCEARHGHFVLRAFLSTDGTWTTIFVSRYVDTGVGDSWGCRSEMESALESGARDAAVRLAEGLNGDLMTFAGDHPRNYLVPTDSLRGFLLMSGGAAPSRTLPYDWTRYEMFGL